jgi:hypothetical protein
VFCKKPLETNKELINSIKEQGMLRRKKQQKKIRWRNEQIGKWRKKL